MAAIHGRLQHPGDTMTKINIDGLEFTARRTAPGAPPHLTALGGLLRVSQHCTKPYDHSPFIAHHVYIDDSQMWPGIDGGRVGITYDTDDITTVKKGITKALRDDIAATEKRIAELQTRLAKATDALGRVQSGVPVETEEVDA